MSARLKDINEDEAYERYVSGLNMPAAPSPLGNPTEVNSKSLETGVF